MASPENKVRVFISSTFRDMHAERDHFVTVVFPELRERCERLGLEFFDVDLRWGVPEKGVDGESANSWEYCRKWINEAKPFFICLLGQRYGWEPEPHQLKDESDQQAQAADRRSITDMEVHHALENDAHSRRCYFYLRQGQAPAAATEFVDPPPLLAKLNALKARVETCGRPVWHYPCRWTGSGFTDMEAFGKKVLEDLWSGILRDPRYVSEEVWQQVLGTDPTKDSRYTDESQPVPDDLAEKLIPLAKPPPKSPLEAERDEMQRFADNRLRWFQGREQELKELLQFIANPAEAHDSPRLAVLAAQPGQGKSALMAKLSESFHHSAFDIPHSPFVVTHFVGATSQSSTAYHLVKRLNDELDDSGIAFPELPVPNGQPKEEPKLDFQSLCRHLWDRLGDYDGERRIVLLLDALNQLDDGHDLGWLPHRLGPGVRIVVSCIDDPSSQDGSPERKVLTALQARFPKPKFVPLGGLDAGDVQAIVEGYLLEYCKQLDAPHVDAICAMPQARNPLYLLVMLAELRTLGGNDMNKVVPELIASMATKFPDTVSLFAWVLQRMEAAEGFGREAVEAWCRYLALGLVGMASRELADLLKRRFQSDGAALTAQRIERGLRRYLQRRGETLDFFHGQLREAVMERYGREEDEIRKGHRECAEYFLSHADPSRDKQWKGEHQRPFQEIAFHLIGSGDEKDWDDLCAYLTDFRCLDVRIRAGQVFAVVTDHRASIAVLPELAEQANREQEQIEICVQYGKDLITYARACGDGKNPPLPQPPTTIAATGSSAFPEEYSLRANRLRAIANFITQQATWLAAHPTDFLTWTANTSADGPLAEAAEAADATVGPWLQRNPRPPTPPLRPQCLQTILGHSDRVKSVSVTPDGRRGISASYDKTLRVWDLQSGQCLHTFLGHTDDVRSVSVTPDGRRAVSASGDETLRVWDLHSGLCLHTLLGHTRAVDSVSVTPDGRRAVSASFDNTLRVWDTQSGECLQTLLGHTEPVHSVRVTPDCRLAVSASHDKTLRVWDPQSGQCLHTILGHTSYVRGVSITTDGRRAVSASFDKTLRVWDLQSGQCLHTLEGHTDEVNSVSVSADGRLAVSASRDKTLRVWDLQSGQCLQTFLGHTKWVQSVRVTPDGRRAVSASSDNTLRVWNVQSGQGLHTLLGHTTSVVSVSVTPDGRRAVSASDDKTLRVWDVQSGQCLHTLEGHTDEVKSVSVSADGRLAVSASKDKTLRVWDLHSGLWLHTLQGHTSYVRGVSITTDGRRAVSTSFDKTLCVWDLQNGHCLQTLLGHTWSVESVSITPDGRRAVSASGDKTLRVWDLQSGQCLHTLLDSHEVKSVSVTPDGRLAVSASRDETLRIWDLQSGLCLHILWGHTGSVTRVRVTPDGRRAVSAGGYDHTLRVWDVQSGLCLQTLQGHTDEVTSVSVTPDGRRAVSASDDNTLRVWDLQRGQCLTVYRAGDYAVTSLAVSPLGDRIVCGTEDGQMHFLTMRNFPPPA